MEHSALETRATPNDFVTVPDMTTAIPAPSAGTTRGIFIRTTPGRVIFNNLV